MRFHQTVWVCIFCVNRYFWNLNIGIDACLEIPECKVRALAIAWRTNTFGLRATCHQCSCPFNRKHVNTCFTTSITGPLALSFEQAKKSPLTLREYTILDHLLNVRRHDLFYREICRLQAELASHNDIAPRGCSGDGTNLSLFRSTVRRLSICFPPDLK